MMSVWRPTEEEQKWVPKPARLPCWKQLVVDLFTKESHAVPLDPVNAKKVKLNVVGIRVLHLDKQTEAFTISLDRHKIELESPVFGDDNAMKFDMDEEGVECSPPWEDDYDFRLEWPDKAITKELKQELAVLQALHYMTEWFGDDLSSGICVDVEANGFEDGSDEEGEGDEESGDDDYTMMQPWDLTLSSGVTVQGKCTKHDGCSDITFVFEAHKAFMACPSIKVARKREEAEEKATKQETKTSSPKKKTKHTPPCRRPMPKYLLTKIFYPAESVGEDKTLDVWQLKQNDPLFKYPELTETQQRKVEVFFRDIMKAKLEEIIILAESANEEDTISFTGQGEDCGTDGLSELDYLLETIAVRLGKDNSRAERAPIAQTILPDTLTPSDLVNGKVALVHFVAC